MSTKTKAGRPSLPKFDLSDSSVAEANDEGKVMLCGVPTEWNGKTFAMLQPADFSSKADYYRWRAEHIVMPKIRSARAELDSLLTEYDSLVSDASRVDEGKVPIGEALRKLAALKRAQAKLEAEIAADDD